MAEEKRAVGIDYTNHAGVRQFRLIEPVKIWFGSTTWHEDAQWLVDAHDVGKNAPRTFAIANIHRWGMPGVNMTADVSIAKQLQNSMELNARMKNRIRALLDNPQSMNFVVEDGVRFALETFLKDQDVPTWPRA